MGQVHRDTCAEVLKVQIVGPNPLYPSSDDSHWVAKKPLGNLEVPLLITITCILLASLVLRYTDSCISLCLSWLLTTKGIEVKMSITFRTMQTEWQVCNELFLCAGASYLISTQLWYPPDEQIFNRRSCTQHSAAMLENLRLLPCSLSTLPSVPQKTCWYKEVGILPTVLISKNSLIVC